MSSTSAVTIWSSSVAGGFGCSPATDDDAGFAVGTLLAREFIGSDRAGPRLEIRDGVPECAGPPFFGGQPCLPLGHPIIKSLHAEHGISLSVDLATYLGYVQRMSRVKVGEFRDRASELIRRAACGETIVILDQNREAAKIVPIAGGRPSGGLIGSLAGTARIHGDIESPIASAGEWFED